MKRICIQWPRFGPYHLTRIRAAHRLFAERGVEVIGLETAGDDATYDWDVETGEEPFRREQVFPDATFEAISAAEMHTEVTGVLDRLSPDAVAIVSYSHPDARACLSWCRRHRRTAVLMSATKEDDADRIAWREYVKALLVRQYDAALVGGTPQRSYLEKLGMPSETIFQPYNVVDNAFFEARAAASHSGELDLDRVLHPGLKPPFFLASNRFVARKNLGFLLRAYALYREQTGAPWSLVLLGDGPERTHLEALLNDEQIQGVSLYGFQQLDTASILYGLAGAFVHPTLQDQWALVVNEAMAAGLPVLVSDRAGCAYDLVAEGENGFVFDPEDPHRLASLMVRISSDDTDRRAMGMRSRAIVSGWSPERFAEGLWNAMHAGQRRSDRGLSALASLTLWALRTVGRRTTSFHSLPDEAARSARNDMATA